jgi:hypothetical protein
VTRRAFPELLLRGLLCALLALACAGLPGVARAQGGSEALVIAAGQQMRGDVATGAQPIEVIGEVLGDVTSWTGDITVRGHVGGDVVSYAGSVVLADGARVDGNVLSLTGAVLQAGTAQVAGQALGDRIGGNAAADLLGLLAPQSAIGVPGIVARAGFGFTFLLVALALATLAALLWPRRTAGVSRVFLLVPGRSAALGLLTTALLAALLLPLAALIALSLVGLPLLLPLLLLLHLPYLYGLTGLGYTLGRRIASNGPERATPLGVLLLLLPAALLGPFFPALGAACFYLVASVGLGAVILSRAGTSAPFVRA